MADEKSAGNREKHTPPGPAEYEGMVKTSRGELKYKAKAQWTVIRKEDEPSAEIFNVSYIQKGNKNRPITFLFNGGPGAASAYLHMGCAGPVKVNFGDTGEAQKPPAEISRNQETWLEFSDLCFVDPVGTGFSRIIKKNDKESGDSDKNKDQGARQYYALNRDLNALCQFMQKFLSDNQRWLSPVFIAGESYGGYRVGKLTKLAQETYGIGLNGAILLSPALEFPLLDPGDYDTLTWIDLFPSMAAGASFHGKSKVFPKEMSYREVLEKAQQFAVNELASVLIQGDSMTPVKKKRILSRAAAMTGLSVSDLIKNRGRIRHDYFGKNLLREEQKLTGLYDISLTTVDPYPDREKYEGPDPTLWGIDRIFSAGINSWLRETIGVKTERDYELLSLEVNKHWKVDLEQHALKSRIGATDDLRYGMSLNPHMKVFIAHGIYDLVTPYHSSTRLVNQMKLTPEQKQNLLLENYPGGHMFYTWKKSRKAFYKTVSAFYKDAC